MPMSTPNPSDSVVALARSIEERYNRDGRKAFPYADCFELQRGFPDLTDGMIPSLDEFCMFIAGYSCGASRLGGRTRAELRGAIPKLKLSFFDVCPQYKPLAEAMSQFKDLSAELAWADGSRRDLVIVMEHVLAAEDSTTTDH
jgi:YxiJ-like protein